MTNAQQVELETKQGTILGNEVGNYTTNETVYEFVGIPYAPPPIGDLRFRPATVFNATWNNSFLNATQYGPKCPQNISDFLSNVSISEDCLFLNIWTPSKAITNTLDDELLPVMLFIHGGGYVEGTGADYNGTQFLLHGGSQVVYISVNYRLGIFGFLQNKEIYLEGVSGIYGFNWPSYGGLNGIYDSIVAIKWVKQFIKQFGGDPNKITIYGQSAGATSVCTILITPVLYDDAYGDNGSDSNDEPFLDGAIVESGACISAWGAYDFELGLEVNNGILDFNPTYGNINNLTRLRELTWQELLYVTF